MTQQELEAALENAYRSGLYDGLKYGPVAANWSYIPKDDKTIVRGWQSLEALPRDGSTIEVQATMPVHYIPGAKFPTLPYHWRPDFPHTEWTFVAWRPLPPAAQDTALARSSDRG